MLSDIFNQCRMIRTVKTRSRWWKWACGGVGRFLTITNMADPASPRMRGMAPVRAVHFDGLPRLLSVILSSRVPDPPGRFYRRGEMEPILQPATYSCGHLGAGDPPLNLRSSPRGADQAVYIDGDGNSRRALRPPCLWEYVGSSLGRHEALPRCARG